MTFLLIDNFDSFTHILADYIRQCGVNCDVVRNNDKRLTSAEFINSYEAIVLSPGPQTPHEGGLMMDIICQYHSQKPMLGICLGHQALGVFFGAKLHKAIQPKHGKVDLISVINTHNLFNHIPNQFHVTRYHSLVLSDLPEELTALAVTEEEEIMALAHKPLPLCGIQFHPESCLTEHGLQMLQNFVQIVKQLGY